MCVRMTEMLNKATQKDLDEMDEAIRVAQARVASLTTAREILAQEVLNRPADSMRPPKNDSPPIDRIAKLLCFGGKKRSDAIAREVGIDAVAVFRILADHPAMFEKDGHTWGLTTTHRQKMTDVAAG